MDQISLILPYWDRSTATDRALWLLERRYDGMKLEVVVVDDGSPEPYNPPPTRLDLKMVRLPEKRFPLNPCVPINAGVKKSKGKFIGLSNAEILHPEPVLEQLCVEAADGNTYASAAVWCPEQRAWHAHSTLERKNDGDVGRFLPPLAQYHFMAVMARELFDRAGGFDEEYRDGAGYDDPDFILRLKKVGARFVVRDDLIVTHPRAGARAKWTQPMFARNRALFMRKWSTT